MNYRSFILVIVLSALFPTMGYSHVVDKTEAMEYPKVDDNTRIRALLRQADNYLNNGNYSAAQKKLELVLQEQPDNEKALELMAICNREVEKQLRKERVEYDNARSQGTIEAFQQFINKYPESEYSIEAQKRIDDFNLWKRVQQIGTKAAYKNYLSTSTIKAYKEDAEKAITEIESKEEWERIKDTSSIEEMEKYVSKYLDSPYISEAMFNINVLRGEQCYKEGENGLALNFFSEARKTRELTGISAKHYEELLLEQEYEALKNSTNPKKLTDFLDKLSTSSKFYNSISNQLALVKAQELNGYSPEWAYNNALSYALDSSTRTMVINYINKAKKDHKKVRRQQLSYAHSRWWKRNFKVGIHFGADMWEHTGSLRGGMQLKLGTHQDIFNISIGADYVWQAFWDNERNSYSNRREFTSDPICHQIAIPLNVKFNFASGSNSCSFYIGVAGEYGYTFAEASKYRSITNDMTLAVEPQIGFIWKYVDWGFYYRKYLKGYNIFPDEYGIEDQRGGMFLTFYF